MLWCIACSKATSWTMHGDTEAKATWWSHTKCTRNPPDLWHLSVPRFGKGFAESAFPTCNPISSVRLETKGADIPRSQPGNVFFSWGFSRHFSRLEETRKCRRNSIEWLQKKGERNATSSSPSHFLCIRRFGALSPDDNQSEISREYQIMTLAYAQVESHSRVAACATPDALLFSCVASECWFFLHHSCETLRLFMLDF